MENNKSCLAVVFYLGERRISLDEQVDDNLFFLKQQLAHLSYFRHNLDEIFLIFNLDESHKEYIDEVKKLVPNKIQNAKVTLMLRENVGFSYGGWSDLFTQYKDKFDYFIFNEDDYFFSQNYWDEYLIKKYNTYPDCGYLCPMVREPNHWNGYRKHLGHSSGIASNENLKKVTDKFGNLPYGKNKDYVGGEETQLFFGFAFIEAGLNLYDFRDDYSLTFAWTEPGKREVWNLWQWNESSFITPAIKLSGKGLNWYESGDGEFLKDFIPTTLEQAIECYNNKITYYGETKEQGNWEKKKRD